MSWCRAVAVAVAYVTTLWSTTPVPEVVTSRSVLNVELLVETEWGDEMTTKGIRRRKKART